MIDPELPTRAAELPAVPPRWRWRRFGGRFLVVSILAHLLFGAGATFWVVQTFSPKRPRSFAAGPTQASRSQRALEHQVQIAKRQTRASNAPTQPKRLAVEGLAKVALPAMPALPQLSAAMSPAKMTGMGGMGMPGAGPGAGGLPGPGVGRPGISGAMTVFGARGGQGLVGTFYDLKQTADRRPSGLSLDDYRGVVGEFLRNGWSESVFGRFFRGPQQLYAPQVFIPFMDASEAPKAFDLANGPNRVEPRMWVVLYKGKVIAPDTGKFRFVGFGDDVLDVAFDGKVVLDGSIRETRLSGWTTEEKYSYEFPRMDSETRRVVPYRQDYLRGDVIEVQAGSVHDLQILIGEWPGGWFMSHLLVERLDAIGVRYETDGAGNPRLPVFQVVASNVPSRMGQPPTAGSGWVWKMPAPRNGEGRAGYP